MCRWLPAVLVCAAAGSALVAAVQIPLDPRALEEAIAIGQSRIDIERTRFRAAYRVVIGEAPVDYLEIVTPFRRVVLGAEQARRAGDRRFGQRDALALLAQAPRDVDVYAELTFHPLNTFLGVPAYEVALAEPGSPRRIEPRTIDRLPRYEPRVDGADGPPGGGPVVPRGSGPLLGATIVARFDGDRLETDGVYDVIVSEGGKELVRGRVDFGKIR